MKPTWRDLKRKFQAAKALRDATFSGAELFAVGGHRHLLGQRAGQVKGLKPVDARIADEAAFDNVDPSSGFLPSYLRAELPNKITDDPGDLAIALNGRIVATAKSSPLYTLWRTGVNLPTDAFQPGKNDIEIYSIPGG